VSRFTLRFCEREGELLELELKGGINMTSVFVIAQSHLAALSLVDPWVLRIRQMKEV
jgi:hypothetical protein